MRGIEGVLKNLRSEIKKIEGDTERGCLKAGFFVEAEATRNAPIDTGNLRGGAYTRRITGGAEVGFEADYAVWVHEIDKNYTVGGWKYLQRALDENGDEILQIIRKDASID